MIYLIILRIFCIYLFFMYLLLIDQVDYESLADLLKPYKSQRGTFNRIRSKLVPAQQKR